MKWENQASFPINLDGENWFGCPRRVILDDQDGWLQLTRFYNQYKAGFLPDPGGTLDQVDRLMTLLMLMEAAYNDCQEVKRQQEVDKRAAMGG